MVFLWDGASILAKSDLDLAFSKNIAKNCSKSFEFAEMQYNGCICVNVCGLCGYLDIIFVRAFLVGNCVLFSSCFMAVVSASQRNMMLMYIALQRIKTLKCNPQWLQWVLLLLQLLPCSHVIASCHQLQCCCSCSAFDFLLIWPSPCPMRAQISLFLPNHFQPSVDPYAVTWVLFNFSCLLLRESSVKRGRYCNHVSSMVRSATGKYAVQDFHRLSQHHPMGCHAILIVHKQVPCPWLRVLVFVATSCVMGGNNLDLPQWPNSCTVWALPGTALKAPPHSRIPRKNKRLNYTPTNHPITHTCCKTPEL